MTGAFNSRRFLVITALGALWATFALTYVGFFIVRFGVSAKVQGWRWTHSGTGWRVTAVDPSGPAAGRLQFGDRILAIDGMDVAARVGPDWFLRDRPRQTSYALKIERNGTLVTLLLNWPVVKRSAIWTWINLLEGMVYLFTGVGIAFAKPNSLSAHRASTAAVLMAAFFCASALNTRNGTLTGFPLVLECVLWCVLPYHVVTNYWFTAGFPLDTPEKGIWRIFAWCLNGWAFLLWLPHTCTSLIRALGPEKALRFATAHPRFVLLDNGFIDPMLNLTVGLTCIGIVLVCLRNYVGLTDQTNKRRLHWVIFGTCFGVIPIILVVPVVIIASLTGNADKVAVWRYSANACGAIVPLCIAYAVVKHRLLGIRVVLRASVQYLLAKNVLRAALFLPVAFLALYLATHLNESVSQLVKGAPGRLNLTLVLLSALALTYRTKLLNSIDRRFFREVYRQDQMLIKLAEAVACSASVDEVSRLLCSEIQAAMHPRVIFLAGCDSREQFSLLYSESADRAVRCLFDFSLTPSQFESLDHASEVSLFEGEQAPQAAALKRLNIQLVVPVRGPNEGFLGLLLLGEKRSEEPYSRNDRKLLDMIASHTGVVWENLRLRERLKGEQDIRHKVLSRIDGAVMDVVQECPECGTCYDSDVSVCSRDSRTLTPSLPMSRLIDGKYLLTRLIGRGGMGVVYQAQDQRLNRVVAVKITAGSLFGNQAALQRFGREARAAAILNHSNVVRVFDMGELPGSGAYMVFEFLHGVTLKQEIRKRTLLPVPEACRVLDEIASGMEAAHRLQIVHRDLKPENVFLAHENPDSQPVAKILDFGLAVIRDLNFSSGEKLTQTGSVIGTLSYMSPEQFLGEPVDQRADIYSFALVALETISGEISIGGPLFSRIDSLLNERLCQPHNSLQHHQLAGVLKRALSQERDARFASVREFREKLIPALSSCPSVPGIQLDGVSPETIVATPANKQDEITTGATRTAALIDGTPDIH